MYSRAHLLIERDYNNFMENQPWGIEAHPIKEDNIFEWTAKILGLKGTIWEGGIFRLYMKYDEYYNSKPPEVCFHTIPYHPNIDMITGKPCVDFLDDLEKWQEKFSLNTVLMSIQLLLSNPVLENAVNTEAVKLIIHSPHAYKQTVQDCVAASQRVEAGLAPPVESNKSVNCIPRHKVVEPYTPKPSPSIKKATKLSFEDYHKTWAGIATSKVNSNTVNPLLSILKEKPSLEAAHFGLPLEELQLQMLKQLEEHNTLMYGKFKEGKADPILNSKQAKLDEINKMRKIYLQPRTPRTAAMTSYIAESKIPEGAIEGDSWEREVDELVAWTTKLDADML